MSIDKFLSYSELTEWLSKVATAHPSLVNLSSYGKSHEHRDLWLVTITDYTTGLPLTKPAHWVDGNQF